ncbi:MAG: T9SS type A sorting domain-containing protein [Bacteroidota bacterium]|jgi:hypothetical protein
MKAIFKIFLIALLPFNSFGQNITCSNFCITNIALDTNVANGFDIQITIEMIGNPSDFVNYPHVSSLINALGDTIAEGGLSWFGQIGGTLQDYPVTFLPNAICTPNFLGYSAVFVFDNDTCTLTFPCTTSITEDSASNYNITLFPNPASDFLTFQSPIDFTEAPAIITIYDQTGRVVKSIESTTSTINISNLPNGFFSVKCKTMNGEWVKKMVKAD